MQRRTVKWLGGFGVMLVIGTVVLANYGTGVPQVGAQPVPPHPFTEGNYTLRWDQQLPAVQRFVVLADFNNEAVLDKETGLVWEQTPAAIPRLSWAATREFCLDSSKGGRKGWRLPTVAELSSLIDPSVPTPGPTLPPGHPFLNVQSGNPGASLVFYWSATTHPSTTSAAWAVSFGDGHPYGFPKTNLGYAWCVRGGMNADAY